MFSMDCVDFVHQDEPHFLRQPSLFMVNARSCIYTLCNLLKPRHMWMPSYLCSSMLKGIPKEIDVNFYPIDRNLRVASMDWIASVVVGDLVLFVDYFGFNLHDAAMCAVKEQGARIVQDAAQALLSTFERPYADFVLYSPRKTVGVPDGGILQSFCSEDFSRVVLKEAPCEFLQATNEAVLARTACDTSGSIEWYEIYQKAEELNPVGHYKMQEFTETILRHAYNYKTVADKRRSNYMTLYDRFEADSLLGELTEDTVPLGFPITCRKRNEMLKYLYERKLFCPVHWPLDGIVPESFTAAHELSHKIITVLCDQRLDRVDIENLVGIIKVIL